MVSRTQNVGYTPTNDSTKTAVANYLIDHVGEWIDTETFTEIGGTSGARRMRELRENGWAITSRRTPGANSREHRLTKAPAKAIQSRFRTVTKAAKTR